MDLRIPTHRCPPFLGVYTEPLYNFLTLFGSRQDSGAFRRHSIVRRSGYTTKKLPIHRRIAIRGQVENLPISTSLSDVKASKADILGVVWISLIILVALPLPNKPRWAARGVSGAGAVLDA